MSQVGASCGACECESINKSGIRIDRSMYTITRLIKLSHTEYMGHLARVRGSKCINQMKLMNQSINKLKHSIEQVECQLGILRMALFLSPCDNHFVCMFVLLEQVLGPLLVILLQGSLKLRLAAARLCERLLAQAPLEMVQVHTERTMQQNENRQNSTWYLYSFGDFAPFFFIQKMRYFPLKRYSSVKTAVSAWVFCCRGRLVCPA